MTAYCNPGDKPKVYVQFNGQSQQIYEPNVSPIDVSSEDFNVDGTNYSETGYGLTFYSPNNGVGISVIARNYQLRNVSEHNSTIDIQLCGQDAMKAGYADCDPSTLTSDNSLHCPDIKKNTLKTKIHIKKSGETVDIFTVTGDHPGTYKVACGNCPDGYCECPSQGYPGYCCLDCDAVARQLHSITQKLKAKNDDRYLQQPSGGNIGTTV